MPITFVQGCCLGTSNLSAVKVILKRLPVLDCRNVAPSCSCLFCPLTLFLAQNTRFFHVFIFSHKPSPAAVYTDYKDHRFNLKLYLVGEIECKYPSTRDCSYESNVTPRIAILCSPVIASMGRPWGHLTII